MDLTHLTIAQLVIVLVVVAAVDTASGILGSISAGSFSVAYVATFLESHVLKRIAPIIGLAIISFSLGDPAGAAVFATALAGLVAYVTETIASVAGNLPGSRTAAVPPSGSPNPPA